MTVVIPTRDRWAFAERAVRTALDQGDAAHAVIVVDDASTTPPPTDGALRDGRVSVLRAEGRGPGSARNAGARAAGTQWLAFLDDDDIWAPGKLARQLEAAEADAADMVYGSAVWIDAHRQPLGLDTAPAPAELPALLRRYNCVPAGASNVLVAGGTFTASGGFDEELSHLADWDLWIRLAATARLAAVAEPLVGYVQHGANMVSTTAGILTEWRTLRGRHESLDHRPFGRWLVERTALGGHASQAVRLAASFAFGHRDPAFLLTGLRSALRPASAPGRRAAGDLQLEWLEPAAMHG